MRHAVLLPFRRLHAAISVVLQVWATRALRSSPLAFRTREALLFSDGLDVWLRNSAVVRVVRDLLPGGGLVLDAGSGWTGIAPFLDGTDVRVVQADRRVGLVAQFAPHSSRVQADARRLPFRDGAFDAVVGVDMIEHILKEERPAVFEEFKRTARRLVILHSPAESSDGRFRGRSDDLIVDTWHRSKFGASDPNLREHIACGHPSIEDFQGAFPGASITGTLQSDASIEILKESRVPLVGLFASLRLKARVAASADRPPYHSALLVWSRHPPLQHLDQGAQRGGPRES